MPKFQNLGIQSDLVAQWVQEKNRIEALQFGLLSPEAIARMSVAEIKSTQIYDQTTFLPNFGAINDPRLGVSDKDSQCYTCKAGIDLCPGHFGHISLNAPVYHAGLLTYIVKILKCVCFNCSKLLISQTCDGQLTAQTLQISEERDRLLKMRNLKNRFKRVQLLSETIHVCESQKGGCGYQQPKLRKIGLKIEVEFKDENFDATKDRKDILWPERALKVLQKISDEDCVLMGLNPEFGRPEWAILRNIAVAPPPVRPSVIMTSTSRSEDDLTYAYQQIIKMNLILKEQKEKGANQTIINELQTSLQYYVATLMDNKIAGQPVQKHKSGKTIKCIRSRLKGKEGRLRGNLMGKRVDFSARTVITPDPNLALDELGVPYEVAKNMTVPESVTAQNIDFLKELVQNGPEEWPGAKYIIRHDGRQVDLSMLRNRSDVHLEIGYVVERHLRDGDYVLFNRQPSLHKMSIMGHRVKVLPYSTFRLNLSVTTPYNADFDGDEMNMHVAQSYESQAEIREIMCVPRQIISPQSNRPVMGIVQDSLLGAMLMTQRDTFVTYEEAMQLCMWISEFGNTGDVKYLPIPAVIKPKPLWTGKQMFSLLLPHLNFALYKDRKNPHSSARDSNILIERGELLQGIVNKSVIGAVGQGLGHIIFKEFGHTKCAEFLSQVQKLVNNWLVNNGFTVGVQDIIVYDLNTSLSISTTLQKFKKQVQGIVHKSQLGKLKSQPGKSMMESFEAQVNKKLNDARDKSGNLALDGLSGENRLRNMVQAGSKGSNINISQIMACVGQQNVEGKRIPFGFHKRTLPHFSKDDFGPESKGFVESSYLSGLSPSELYFHAMGGREGLIDTAVKTAETGYISRRLIKALEDIMVQYDGTVRSSRNDLVQFVYGEDGISGEHVEDLTIDLIKSSDQDLTQECRFPSISEGEKVDQKIRDSVTPFIYQELHSDPTQMKVAEEELRQIFEDRHSLRNDIFRHTSDDQIHLPVNLARLILNTKAHFGINCKSKSDLKPITVAKKLNSLIEELNVLPGANLRSNKFVTETDLNARQLFNIFLRYNLCSNKVIMQERLSASSFEYLLGEIKYKFEQAIVNPGEMVGSIAAQSMGEPATQMTLNTFHFAGISAKNVTLGVPRFKEIINVATNIKTPGLKIFLKNKHKKSEESVSKLGMMIEYSTLSHVVNHSGIYYDPDPERTVIPEDIALVQLYNEVPVLDETCKASQSPWLLRFELDKDKMVHKGLQMALIDRKLSEVFADQVSLMVSDENSDNQVIRIRINNIEDDSTETVASYIKNEFEPLILNHLALKGLPEISKVTYTKQQEHSYCKETGKLQFSEDNWIIETDGSALAKILPLNKVDATKTVSNDILEIMKVFGCEAARQSLINELRFVFSSYGIYVNYRHISTLVDVMTHSGKLTSITRHGINRVESSGPLRKCSFEETVEILLEGAMFSEIDWLSGISENIIMGQLGPFGSGSFGIILDSQIVDENATQVQGFDAVFERDSWDNLDTPMLEGRDEIHKLMTPMLGLTPSVDYATAGSQYKSGAQSAYMTPGNMHSMHCAFSPNPVGNFDNHFASPNYQSPSPYYGSPQIAGKVGSNQYGSPIYNQMVSPMQGSGQYLSSPIYQLSGSNQNSKLGGTYVSPIYQQTGPIGSNQYSPAYVNNAQSPSYGRQMTNRVHPVSPMYSPSAAITKSPGYSGQDKHMSSYSPAYTPPALQSPSQGAFQVNSAHNSNYKAHQMTNGTPLYVPPNMGTNASADAMKNLNSGQPQYEQSSAQVAPSPSYNPASPHYSLSKSQKKEQVMAHYPVSGAIKEESDESE